MRNSTPGCWSLLFAFLALCLTPFAIGNTVPIWLRFLIWAIVALFAIPFDRNSTYGCGSFLSAFLTLGLIIFGISDRVSQWILLLIWGVLLRQLSLLNLVRILYNPWLQWYLIGLGSSLVYHLLEPFTVSGINPILAQAILIVNVHGMFRTRVARLLKGYSWYSSPFLLVFPCIALGWLLCGQLTQVLSNPQIAIVVALLAVLLSLRDLIEIPAAAAFIGLFIAHNAAVFFGLALPSIAGYAIGKACISFIIEMILQRVFKVALRDSNQSVRLLHIITWLGAAFQPEYYQSGLLLLGMFYAEDGQFEKASRSYKKSIYFSKNNVYVTFTVVPMLAECLIQAGQQEDAIKHLEQWLSLLEDQKAPTFRRQMLRATFWRRFFVELVARDVEASFSLEDLLDVFVGIWQVRLLLMLSKSHHYLGNLQQALTCKNETLTLLDGTENDNNVSYKGLLDILEEMQEFTKPLLRQLPSLGISPGSFAKFKDQLHDMYQQLSEIKGVTLATLADIHSDHLNQHDKALSLAIQALNLYQKVQNKRREALQHVYIGSILGRQGRFEEAQEHYETALTGIGHWESDLPPEHQLTTSVAQIHMASLFLDNRKFDSALLLYKQVEERRVKSLRDVWSIQLQLGAGIAFCRLNRIEQARKVLLDGLALAETLKHQDGQRLIYFWLAKTYAHGMRNEMTARKHEGV